MAKEETPTRDMVVNIGEERMKANVIHAAEERIRWMREEAEIAKRKIVAKWKETPWVQSEQGLTKSYQPLGGGRPDIALKTMVMFVNDIQTHGGKHTHQGGLALFVLEGKGYSVVDGVRYDWEEGDLILLPIKKGGCEHQHFNLDPDKPARWLALGSIPLRDLTGRVTTQIELHPEWKGEVRVARAD